ncbi:substrate-binding periplasmic protein [Permianibacter aggregans]|uniref:ABC-type amino acid transport substrate-binding protein n=1 Tax=Permianibacter aggregans TaxID=1510150 RepID=A0A4R6UVV5_9GAMM|nr:ABC transporter substrate-binding protein [Permianibacter aggregans]TDQ47644.1 ABC-type amino acid transport substrate-binding protein [Permianibacter aggregans]
MRRVCLAMLLLTVAFSSARAGELDGIVRICEDEHGWRPFSYWEAASGRAQVIGFSVDIIDRIFTEASQAYRIEMVPWARCLRALMDGQSYDMTLSISHSKERAEKLLLSAPYYQTTTHLFYRRVRFAEQPSFTSPQHLSRFRLCGLHGAVFPNIDIPPASIEQSAQNMSSLLDKLRRDRCDFVVNALEVWRNDPVTRELHLHWDPISSVRIAWQTPQHYYMAMANPDSGRARALKSIVDQGLQQLQQRGELQLLRKKWRLDE